MKKRAESRIEVTIELKPYLARFIQGNLPANENCVFVDSKSVLGTFFYGMVEKRKPRKRVNLEHSVTLSMPAQDCYGGAYDGRSEALHINKANTKRINDFLEFVMKKELYIRLDFLNERNEIQRKTGLMKDEILKFMSKYDIPETEISYDGLKKGYYRHQKRGLELIEQIK